MNVKFSPLIKYLFIQGGASQGYSGFRALAVVLSTLYTLLPSQNRSIVKLIVQISRSKGLTPAKVWNRTNKTHILSVSSFLLFHSLPPFLFLSRKLTWTQYSDPTQVFWEPRGCYVTHRQVAITYVIT